MLTGQRTPDAGTLTLDGRPVHLGSIRQAMDAGIGFTPEDRHLSGYVPALSVAENATLGIVKTFTNRLHLISGRKRDAAYQRLADEWSIKAHGTGQPTEEPQRRQPAEGGAGPVGRRRPARAGADQPDRRRRRAGQELDLQHHRRAEAARAVGARRHLRRRRPRDLRPGRRDVRRRGRPRLLPPFSEKVLAAAVQGADGATEPSVPVRGVQS
ncbi:hypothetical protein GCM10025868_36110 [Angustibacter aerolatus]|uniref:ABC transporter domain-containing protein n=1 Tax=Angustibacter aerolatus TaxID=1162965 RepID=A0ABQ6JJC6_9ACTN|nr:hypothetical protein GCM10025868_36110 [Angustibacter aerolatus]